VDQPDATATAAPAQAKAESFGDAITSSAAPAAIGIVPASDAPALAMPKGDTDSLSALQASSETPSPLQPTTAPTASATPLPPTSTATTVLPRTSTPVPPTSTLRPAPTSTPVQPPAAPVSLNAMEQAMLAAHNTQRASNGLAALQIDATLTAIARHRAQDMATNDYFSHTSPTGETAFTLIQAAGYPFSLAGENIARNNYPNDQTVSVAMTGFMNSAGHRENILEPRFVRVGIGVAVDANGMKYFAVVFAG
jgi:uncharacterized protein YkwD